MNKKLAFILEWVGVGIILLGVALFAFIFVKKIQLIPLHYAILLWVLGFGILCYIPKSIILYEEKKNDPENPGGANIIRRSLIIRFICALALILYGAKVLLV